MIKTVQLKLVNLLTLFQINECLVTMLAMSVTPQADLYESRASVHSSNITAWLRTFPVSADVAPEIFILCWNVLDILELVIMGKV